MTDSRWRTLSIKELCEGIYDGPHATPKKTESGPWFLGISSLDNGRLDLARSGHLCEDDYAKWTRRVTPHGGDIVFSYETRLGQAAVIPEGLRCCLGRRMALMRPNRRRVDPRFLLYAFLSPGFQAALRSRTIHGSTVERILLTEFPNFPIQVPDIQTQRRIGGLLGALDDKIDLNRRTSRTLESIARAIFKSWFVDFDPVRTKTEGTTGGEAGLPPSLAALFPDALEPSVLGPIPAGWRVSEIGREVSVVGGSTPRTSTEEYWDGDICFSTPKDLAGISSSVLLDTERRVTREGAATISSGVLSPGTVLMSSRAPIGYLAINETPVCVNQGFIAMRCDECLPSQYVLHWARSSMDAIVGNANGTTFLEISKRNFRPLPVIVPERPVLQRFAAIADCLHARIVAAERENRTLADVRDAVLPKLLSGEVCVSKADDAESLLRETPGWTR